MQYSTFYQQMPDGTVKQINPFTGNEVWAVPGRAARPIQNAHLAHIDLLPGERLDPEAVCSFCEKRYFEVPPEKVRWVRQEAEWTEVRGLLAEQYFDTTAEFRCVPNLFEIVSLDYWKKNYGYTPPLSELRRMEEYAATELGMRHLREIIAYKMLFTNLQTKDLDLDDNQVLQLSQHFFGGCHELIIARRHFVSGTEHTAPVLLSSGLLTPDEHYFYVRTTVEAMQDILERNRYVRYVSVFQNWLQPAGASFDHLHKQLVGLDEWGASISRQVRMLKEDPNVFNDYGANFAAMYNLVFAENDHAIAFVGIGHRHPTIEIFSKSAHARPYEHDADELQGVSDLIHASHAAMGPDISCNEEWYYSPADSVAKMPWHVLIKWRITVPAGFEGGTSIYINPMTPLELRDRMVPRLYALRDSGSISSIRIAEECIITPNPLKYHLG